MLADLQPNEHLIKKVRKHWFVFFVEALLFVLIAVTPFIFWGILNATLSIELGEKLSKMLLFFYSLWILFVWIGFFIAWTGYYLDVWLLTDKRVIDIDQKALFYRDIASIRLDKIQDIKIITPGLFASLFGYGDIHIQSAGADKEFKMRNIERPERTKELLTRLYSTELDKPQDVRVVPN